MEQKTDHKEMPVEWKKAQLIYSKSQYSMHIS